MPEEEGQAAMEDSDLFTGALVVRVATLAPPKVVAATVTPLNLGTNEPELTAIVAWEGIETVTSSVRLEADPQPWSRLLHLLWAVLGPDTTPESDELRAGNWSSVVLST